MRQRREYQRKERGPVLVITPQEQALGVHSYEICCSGIDSTFDPLRHCGVAREPK